MAVYEIYVEKKPDFADEAASLASELRNELQIQNVKSVRIIHRYFVENILYDDFITAKSAIFSEPPVDIVYDTLPLFDAISGENARVFAVEYLPGQFDQRSDSAAQCISLATGKERPLVRGTKIYAVYGGISDDEWLRIKAWLVNPVESREAAMEKPGTLFEQYPEPSDVAVIEGFAALREDQLDSLGKEMGLAMDSGDLDFCQKYFRDEEKRDPTVTELRVLDTYWSDHCRHTTFLTELTNIEIEDEMIRKSYADYLALRKQLGRAEKPLTLMDMATIGAKALKKRGLLPDIDESEEINACSVKIKVDIDGKKRNWLLMFKNETHNHPTEIEPFGGAATCLGGAIRDPLSGRAFVYQAMRLTGAANPLQNAADTLPGKLPQRKICRTAAAGYSSYGNQIGLATGHVHELYHSGYMAKRMEIGAVIGAAPAENVIRKKPKPGDIVILLGGRTGRDGCGGATGSSKSHTADSLENCGAEVQKGNAPEERKLQRLFRNRKVTRLIKRCNDFGAGGVSVSIGELADGLEIDLSKILKKYEGLDGTELAISESQERMSVVVAKKDANAMIALAAEENIEAIITAVVTKEKRLVMKWKGRVIVNLSRKFLNSNGKTRHARAFVPAYKDLQQKYKEAVRELAASELEPFISSLAYCSQKGLVDRFDSVIGAATVVMPFGGKWQLTPAQSMAAKIPVLKGNTTVCSLMSWGFDPDISTLSPYHGAVFAVVHSLAKIIASGGSRRKCWLSFQEYFERLRNDPARWGKPVSALLGVLDAQLGLELAAIGGKDSMSGSFETIDVPPTLVSFAVSVAHINNIITPEFKGVASYVYHLKPDYAVYEKTDYKKLSAFFDAVEKLIANGKIASAWAVGTGGTAEAVIKMCIGNHIGFKAEKPLASGCGFGGFVIEAKEPLSGFYFTAELLGRTKEDYVLTTQKFAIQMNTLQNAWENTLRPVYPYLIQQDGKTESFNYKENSGNNNSRASRLKKTPKTAKPIFVITVFPGTNSEYDTARAIEKSGGRAEIVVVRNLTPADIAQSVQALKRAIDSAQGIVIPGGFSGGDEPDGSGKFITAFFRNPSITEAVTDMLQKNDGLICGICNGFQALIKLGLVPYGEIRNMADLSPTLTYNKIGRHQSTLVRVRIASNKSPWLSHLEMAYSYSVPISHGEGRFIASEECIRNLARNGQIATQYVDFDGKPSQDIRFNPNNSAYAIEGITSPDGRVFGRMGHNERYEEGLYKNIPDTRGMNIFAGAVGYFR
jgi:phosphoribosylformylglycinamidine synthase